MLRELLAAGFSTTLARRLLDKLPAGRGAEEASRWIRTVLARNVGAMANEDALIERGGYYADLYRRQTLEEEIEEIA